MKKSKLNLDAFWQKTLMRIMPKWISPNSLSIARLLLVPLIIWLIWEKHYPAGLLLFIITALTDSLDGALARTYNKITPLGLIIDPLADKLLIASTAIIFIWHYPFPELLYYLIAFELIIVITSFFWLYFLKRPATPANAWGKLKMVCESLSLVSIFFWLIFPNLILLYFSVILLLLSLLFLIISAIKPLKLNKNS